MEKNKQRLILIDTTYSLFLYLLIFGFDERDFFVFSRAIPKNIRNKFNHMFFIGFRYYIDFSSPFLFIQSFIFKIAGYFFRFYGTMKLRLFLFLKFRNSEVEVYGQGELVYAFPMYEYEKSYSIEEGLGNYSDLKVPTKHNFIYEKIRNFCGYYIDDIYEGFGTHDNIKKVYLTRDKAPEIIKDKSVIVDVNKMWENKSSDEKKILLSIFNLNIFEDECDTKEVLLLTQPLSEAKYMSLDEEIEIYQYFIDKYGAENIIIKIHPAEKKEYSKIFPDVEVLYSKVPIELLKFCNFKFDKIATVCSSGALNLCDDYEIDIYDKKTSSDSINYGIEVLNNKIKE